MSLKKILAAGAAAIAVASATGGVAYAQQTTAAVRGVITNPSGQPVSGAKVTIIDTRTGSRTQITTGSSGVFSARGLPVGGPYTVVVDTDDYQDQTIEGVTLSLGDTANVNVGLDGLGAGGGDEIVVTATRATVADVATGPAATFNLADLQDLPTVSRDIKDIIRLDPRVYIDETFGDGIYCVGSSNRANSLTVDGVRQNDDFGLNGNGYPTQRLPFPFDAAEQVSVEIAPFDVEYGQFTGCNINVVTKSGTNEFHGRAFVDYLPGDIQSSSIRKGAISLPEREDELSYGGVVTGPIIKDRLFFTFAYEKFKTKGARNDNGPIGSGAANIASDISQSDLDQIANIMNTVYGFDPLGFDASGDVTDRRFLGKIDAYITEDHRFEFTAQDTNSNRLNINNSSGTRNDLSFASNWYNTNEKLRTYSGRFFSDWTDAFSTEIRVAWKEQRSDQAPLAGGDFAQFQVLVDGDGDSVSNGEVFLGPDQFRHANRLSTEVLNIKAKAEYQAGQHLFKFGYERDDLDTFNLFVDSSEGVAVFNSIADLQAQTPASISYRNAFTNNEDDGAAAWSRVLNTVYVQDDFQLTPELLVTVGLRYDWYGTNDVPLFNPTFQARYGIRNDKSINGLDLWQPRFGFDWRPTDRLQITGGAGVYSGGDPGVWVSNGYTNTGVTLGRAFSTNPLEINGFDGLNIPAALQAANTAAAATGSGDVDALAPDYEIPSIVRGALGAKFDVTDTFQIGGDFLYTRAKNPNEWLALTLAQVGVAADGRPIYQGRDALDPDCPGFGPGASLPSDGSCPVTVRQDYLLRNSDEVPVSYTLSGFAKKSYEWSRGNADLLFGYAYTDAEDVNPGTSSRAVSNFENLSTQDYNNSRSYTSNYSIKHRLTARLDLEHEFFRDAPTQLSFFGQLSSGRPFSYTFDSPSGGGDDGRPFTNNPFGDEDQSEDRSLLYVPATDAAGGDGVVTYAPGFDLAAFNAFVTTSGLDEYRGRIAPRNGFRSDWWGKLDMRFQQTVPAIADHRLSFIVDIENLTNLINSKWGVYKEIGFSYENPVVVARTNPDGTLVYESFSTPRAQSVNTSISGWTVQFGLRYDF
ncbi:MAG: carboxypeptidase regulatory-like domain-containing protein [Parvularculaceae bacterium]